MWRIFAEAEEVVSIEVPLYYYLFHQNSTMTSSSAERILTGYQAFTALTTDGSFAADFSERPFILPRWVLGALNSTARIAENYGSFSQWLNRWIISVIWRPSGSFRRARPAFYRSSCA